MIGVFEGLPAQQLSGEVHTSVMFPLTVLRKAKNWKEEKR